MTFPTRAAWLQAARFFVGDDASRESVLEELLEIWFWKTGFKRLVLEIGFEKQTPLRG